MILRLWVQSYGFLPFFQMGDFFDFLFASLDNDVLNWGLHLMEQICSFPLRIDSIEEGGRNENG